MTRQMIGRYTAKDVRTPAQRRSWHGFTVCLFIVLLSVFTWVVHRRLTQYQALPSAGGHHMTATKVCLTERPRISVPSADAMDGIAMFLAVISFALLWFRADEMQASRIFRTCAWSLPRPRIQPCLTYFYSLPPPVLSRVL